MRNNKICVIGLGYVGLPLAFNLSKHFELIGFDSSKKRILDLKDNVDQTNEIKTSELKKAKISFTYETKDIQECNIYIVTVPTPINSKNNPQITSLISVTKMIASHLKNNDLIIYESTVFPGCTEEILIPLIEKISKKKLNKNFHVGYSPERIDLVIQNINSQIKLK